VFVGAFLTLQTRPARDAITGLIATTIAQNTRSVCRIEALSGNLLSRFEITGVALEDAKTGVTLMSADRIAVSYSVPMLLGRVLWINRLAIDGVSVNLLQASDGTWNFEMLSPENPPEHLPESLPDNVSASKASSNFKIEIRQLAVSDSDITLSQQTAAGEITRNLKGLNCHAGLAIGKDISIKIKDLAVFLDNPHVDLRDLSGDICYNIAENRVDFVNTRIQGEKSDFTVNGLLRFPDQTPNEVKSDDVKPNEIRPNVIKPDKFTMDLRADVKALSLGEFGRAFPIQMPDEDIVSGKLFVSGPLAKMDCQVDLRLDDCHVVSQGLVTINELNDVGLDLTGKISGLDLSALPVLDLDDFPGNLNTKFSLAWQQIGMPDQTGQIHLTLTSSVLQDYIIDQAKLNVRILGDDFIFENLDLKTPYGTLAGDLSLDGILSSQKDNQIQFTTDIKAFNPEMFIPEMYRKANQYAGSINGTVASTIFIPKTFALEGLTADVTCRINPSQMMDVDVISAEMEATLRDEKITVSRFDMKTLLGSAGLTGEASIKDETCGINAHVLLPDLKLIKPFFPNLKDDAEFSGSITASADIDGRWNDPRVTAVLNGEKVVVQGISTDSISADGQWKGNTKDFSASGKCVMENIQNNGLRISVMDFETTMSPASIQAAIEIQGTEKESFKFSGNISHWLEPVKEVLIDKFTLVSFGQPPMVNKEPFKLMISDDRITVESMCLDSGNASLALNGEAVFTPPAHVLAELALRDFDLKRISGFWEGGEKIHGQLSSEVSLSGLLPGVGQLQGNLSSKIILTGELKNPTLDINLSIKEAVFDKLLVSDAAADIKFSDSKARVTASAHRQNEKLLDVNGTALMSLSLYPFEFAPKSDGLDLQMNLEQVDISWISDIVNDPEYDVTGFLNATATVSGDLSQPFVQGRMQLRDGSLNLKKQQMIYENLVADLKFAKKTITIDDLSLKGDNEGSLHLSGVLTHDNFKPQIFNIRAVGDHLYIPFHSGVDARINPDLTLSGTWAAPVLSGEIKVPEGRVNLQRFLEKKIPEIEIIEQVVDENGVLKIPEKEPKPLEFVDALTADVSVIIPDDFWFRGEDEFFEIKGDIQLKKDPHKPFVLFGSVMPVRGTYRFRGRIFQIKQGELIFNGQEDINPVINIQAETTVDDVTIIICLAGTFEQINLILDSDPAMSQADIISYLVFGRAPDDLSEEESFQAGEAALSYTGQIAADKLRDIIGDTLGIDYLSISAGSDGLRQGSLTMGKYVLPKVFVTFRQGFDESATQKVEVTYEINKYFDLETQIDNEQTSAVDLIWKYEY
ncbi:MAG: translocation/assembly module TamB domain-containing protein, partial [Desulfobacteraceae bacterium]|jgi:hypothetical protein|nr:translocation/assembly module TamB domain-containing protein [Desulfobacteraceae bacterium]